MKFISHITLNTGHVRKTYPNEVDKSLFFRLNRIYKESFEKDGAILFDEYLVKGTKFEGGSILTLYSDDGLLPILTTASSKHKHTELWETLHSSATVPLATQATNPADGPFIVDRLEIGAMTNMDILKWTGDFSRCMGWASLNPRKIR
ncbi:hypothetical protein CAY60_021285 [Shouchella clausii]|uniref:hypothetical protein n=1 Tax=Bacteria TaxID=2 RepID=UPI00054DCEE3|nr:MULTISPECIES: hypothetical protein [Bacteria]ALA55226.1 hypothetical protein DB29_0P0014 [Shouchella clausii]MBU3266281.1 hypothetical protein [Shouchella clausii]MBU3509374.1 hypothetical protein [Shouchella clausii]MDP0461987.1 hypothetical protein [Shouchella rhizosphaerae]MDP5267782.1 hypothetical protein [Shouchella clausii]